MNGFGKLISFFSVFFCLFTLSSHKNRIFFSVSNSVSDDEIFDVFCCADDENAPQTAVAISSLLSNVSPDYELRIHIVSFKGEPMSEENINKIETLNNIRKFKLEILEFDKKKLEIFSTDGNDGKWSPAIIIKLFAGEIFPNLDKILWIDDDIIIRNDITELLKTNLNDKYMAAVDTSYYHTRYHPNRKSDYWINAGFGLYNLKEIRQDKLQEKLINKAVEYGKNEAFMKSEANQGGAEEYAFTYEIPKEKILLLSYRYCVIPFFDHHSKGEYFKNERDDIENSVVIHYAGGHKPWKKEIEELNPFFKQAWDKYHKISPFAKKATPWPKDCSLVKNLFKFFFNIYT